MTMGRQVRRLLNKNALDDPEDGESLVVAFLNDSLPGLFGS